jgi:fumarate hydratase class I
MARRLTLPFTEEQARAFHVGDEVLVSGRLVTARAAAHRRLVARPAPEVRVVAQNSLVYHCALVTALDPHTGVCRAVAAGPSASIRQEPWQAEVLARYRLRGILGEGGMGPCTLSALARLGAVYLHVPRELAAVHARRVSRVVGAHLSGELGDADAIWCIDVEDLPAIVTMDAHGRSLHASTAFAPAREDALRATA